MFANRLKTLRSEANLTQQQLSEKLGVTRGSYAQWESKRTKPNGESLQKLADFFNVSTDYLLGNTDEKNSTKFEDDLEKSLDSFHAFSGKKMTDNDREAIRDWLTEHFKDK
ncbi:helix-turn-helix transcriptional regulator [Pseudolactococcus yaeyamensis]